MGADQNDPRSSDASGQPAAGATAHRRRSGRLPTHGALLIAALDEQQLRGWYGPARDRLIQRVEEAVELSLPQPLRSLLRLREGMRKGPDGFYFRAFGDGSGIYPLDRVMVAKRRLDMLLDLPPSMGAGHAHGREGLRSPGSLTRDPVRLVASTFWRRGLLPVADNPVEGWVLAVDTSGELSDEAGAVVRIGARRFDVVAADPGAWLEHLAELAEDGRLFDHDDPLAIYGEGRRSVLRVFFGARSS